MLKWLFSCVGCQTENDSLVSNRQWHTLVIASLISLIVLFVDILQNFDHGFDTLAYIEMIVLPLVFLNFILFRICKKIVNHSIIFAFLLSFIIVISFVIEGYGVDIMLFWLALLPTVLFLLLSIRHALVASSLVYVFLIGVTINSYFRWIEPLFSFEILIQLALVFPFYVLLVYLVEVSRFKAENKVLQKDKEKAVLLKEVHHRVKNNMQIIMSLLWLQSEKIEDPKYAKLFLENIDRLSAMALVHESIYKAENFESINMKDYLQRIIANLSRVSVHHIKSDIENITLDMKSAMNLGLIVNEIVTNAFEHAYKDTQEGVISIYLHEIDNNIVMKVKDFGQGFDNTLSLNESLGFSLIQDLASSLDESSVKIEHRDGVEVLIQFTNGGSNVT